MRIAVLILTNEDREMKSLKTNILSLTLIAVFILSGCVQTVQQSSTMYVRDLVQSDVFEVLPENNSDIAIFEYTEDIQGEYLELATVQIEELASNFDREDLVSKLKQEAYILGGNAVLIVEEKQRKEGKITKTMLKGIAIFALDAIPSENEEVLASLPS